jgi:hypothetical protein
MSINLLWPCSWEKQRMIRITNLRLVRKGGMLIAMTNSSGSSCAHLKKQCQKLLKPDLGLALILSTNWAIAIIIAMQQINDRRIHPTLAPRHHPVSRHPTATLVTISLRADHPVPGSDTLLQQQTERLPGSSQRGGSSPSAALGFAHTMACSTSLPQLILPVSRSKWYRNVGEPPDQFPFA